MLVMAVVMIEVKVQTDGMRVPHQQNWSLFPRCFFDMKPLHLREGDFFDAWQLQQVAIVQPSDQPDHKKSTRKANVSCVDFSFVVDWFPR